MSQRDFDALTIGVLFTVVSFLLTLTFVIPVASVFPGVVIEFLIENLVGNNRIAGITTIILLATIFMIVFALVLIRAWRATRRSEKISKRRVALIMVGMYFIVHPLGFYIYWALALDFRGDGQLIFLAVDSFPISSCAFIPIGLAIDIVKNFKVNNLS